MATTPTPGTAYGTFGSGPSGQGLAYVPVYSQAYGLYGSTPPPPPSATQDFNLSASDNGPIGSKGDSDDTYDINYPFTAASIFHSGTGTIELLVNGTWTDVSALGTVPAHTVFKIRVRYTAPFSATLTLTF